MALSEDDGFGTFGVLFGDKPSVSCVPRNCRVSVTAGSKMLRVTSRISSYCMSLLGLGRANLAAAAVAGSGESAMSCSLMGGSVS